MAINKKLEYFKNSNSTPMTNIPTLQKWKDSAYSQIQTLKNKETKYKFFSEINTILKDNKKFLLDKIGKQDFCVQDSSNRRLYCWHFNIENEGEFWIITAPERGTSIEVSILEGKEKEFSASFFNKIRNIFDLSLI